MRLSDEIDVGKRIQLDLRRQLRRHVVIVPLLNRDIGSIGDDECKPISYGPYRPCNGQTKSNPPTPRVSGAADGSSRFAAAGQ